MLKLNGKQNKTMITHDCDRYFYKFTSVEESIA